MKKLPLLLVLAIGIFLAFRTLGTTGSNHPPTKYEKILNIVGSILSQGHYSPKEINDDFSVKVFNQYFEDLDPEKNIFLKQDLDALQKYATSIDDEIKGAPVQFFIEAGKIFDKRVEEAASVYKSLLAKPFDFSVNETYTADPKKKSFPATEAERKEAWRKYLKFLTLQRFVELQEARESNKGKEGAPPVKTDAELEAEAREKVMAAMNRRFDHYRVKFNEDEKFTVFVNVITNLMDPHTEFMPPLDKRYFDEMLSGRFYGIGAQLQYDEGNIKIASVLPGGPAHKSGEVEAGDIIIRVVQGSDSAVEIVGYNVEDAVKIIRGKKGTEVRLTLRKKDGQLKNVNLIREEIVQDESYVRSAVIRQGNAKIGYIFLPEFYADFENPGKPRSGNDVAKEVNKLKQENIEGIVIDLRNNGGGSLYDVIQIAGLFIDRGPVVQVRDRQGKAQVMEDRDPGILWDGPLVIMVNEMSASASEILAAAMQDYGRGIVIGSTSTYGKGTVQRPIGLDPQNFMNTNSELGSLKLTLQKFYRINGGSTQMRGVASDIVLPDQWEYLKIRERENPNALPWDEVKKADYKTWRPAYNPESIKKTAVARIAADSVFQKIRANSQIIGRQSEREYSLQLERYKQDQKQMREVVKQMENLMKLKNAMDISFLKQDEKKYYSEDKDKTERYKQWLTNISRDIYVNEAVKIINDMALQSAVKTTPVAANRQ